METDNFNNSLIEIRHKERMLRSSKSRSMTPVVRSSSNHEETSAADKNEVSSTRHSTGRKVVTSSTKSVSKTKTIGGKTSMTVIVEKNSSQEKSAAFPKDILVSDESVTRLTAKNDNMELRSERQKAARHSNRFIANGTGKEEAITSTKTSVNKTARNHNRTARMRTSDYSSDDEEVLHDGSMTRDLQSQRVLDVYQGDFWNKLPKTDFTYSPVSKDHYKEVAPGVTVKPNMSRSTYQHHTAATSTPYVSPPRGAKMSTTTTTTSTTTRRSRFFDAGKAGTKVPAYIAQDYAPLDSDEDEVDTRVRAEVAAASSSTTFASYFTTFFSAVWTVVTTCWTTTVETTMRAVGLRNNEEAAYSTPVRGQQTTRSRLATMLDYIYLLPAYVTSADLTLLSSTAPEGGGPKRLRLFSALMLLLLLLLCGWWLLYYLGLEDTMSSTPVLLSHAQTATWAWMGTLGEWCRMFGGWIFLPFAARQTTQQDEWAATVPLPPPMTMATPPLSPPTAPSLPVDVDTLLDRLLASDRFRDLLTSRLDRPVEAALTGSRFVEWISSRVEGQAPDVDLLAASVWDSGRLQGSVQAYLAEKMLTKSDGLEAVRAGLMQELNDKSQYFELHNTKVAAEIAKVRQEFEQKLNASISEMKAKLREDLLNNEELIRTQQEEIRLLKVQLAKCCNNKPIPWEDIDAHVLRYVAGVYGVGGSEGVDRAELRALVGSMFVGRQQLEAALANVTAQHRAEMREVSEQSAQTMMDAISARISDELATHVGAGSSFNLGSETGSLTYGRVQEIVNRAIMTYDADKTGMVDYALESSGGSVISTRCTESYYKHSASMTLFGIPYWYPVNTPRTVIQPGVHPGECWAFRGSQGFLVIQLAGLVQISSFSVEHIPRSLAFSGNIDSAPRDFSVWGLEAENDLEPTELGKYTYLKNSTSLQYFLVARSDVPPFKIIELRIDSNHGNLEYTCLYRFRVHGSWVSY